MNQEKEIIVQLAGMPKIKVSLGPIENGVGAYIVSMLKEEARDLTEEEQKRLFDYLHNEGWLGLQAEEAPEIKAVVDLRDIKQQASKRSEGDSLSAFLTN